MHVFARFLLKSATTIIDRNDDNKDDELCLITESVDILYEILLRIDCIKVLLTNCVLVCKKWNDILSLNAFWKRYANRYSIHIPSNPQPYDMCGISYIDLKKICYFKPFERNLIKNGNGEDRFQHWHRVRAGGQGIIVEAPPIGCCNNELDGRIVSTAFATSFGWGTISQTIDLCKEGFDPELLDCHQPPITVSDKINCRRDCPSVYCLRVILSSADNISSVLENRFGASVFLADLEFQDNDAEDSDVHIRILRRFNQETDCTWRKVEYTFARYPKGIRYIFFERSGKDLLFWSGHYGAKMTEASVIVHTLGRCS